MHAEAVSRESANSSLSGAPAEPPGLVESHSGGQTMTGHFNTVSSSLPHMGSLEITAAPGKRPLSGPLRGASASADLRATPSTAHPRSTNPRCRLNCPTCKHTLLLHTLGPSNLAAGCTMAAHASTAPVRAEKKAFLEQQFQMTGGTGSYTFMAGEIFRHEPYNAKADVYSFAMVLYEMLAGERPFARLDPIMAAMRAATDGLRPEWPRDAPAEYSEQERELLPEVQALVERCWAASPMMRCARTSCMHCVCRDRPPRQRPRAATCAASRRRAWPNERSGRRAVNAVLLRHHW